ncbi:DNA cytosine methyltransferase [Patescibacteria group bacterium]|nr:DNA cytosine methyltransferase [Patescibacteria group bacterium]MDE1946764.1 DNA cytosine methyltransferase [Patescibacteria group bacterium]MDE2010933.1 DNA cytosine methyltransferase [Patescibacteria group bacterium]MDE2233616.1 DNA cytosine methyltransferase [Patescibacteria group bacterium]
MSKKVIDLFSGVGGLSYGFANDRNFEIVAANEILPNMAKAYSLNHPSVKMYAEDIKNFTADRLAIQPLILLQGGDI